MKLAGFAAICVLALAGCRNAADRPIETKTSEGQTAGGTAEGALRDPALVRFVNAEPTIDRADLWVDDQPAFTAVNYKAVTQYKEMPGDRAGFRLRGAGASNDLAANKETLKGGRRYTIVSMRKADNTPMLTAFTESAGPRPGVAAVRLINAAGSVGEMDLGIAGRKETLISGVKFGQGSDFRTVDPGAVVLEVRHKEKKTAGVPVQSRTLEAGKLYTLIALGDGQQDVLFIEDEFSTKGAASR